MNNWINHETFISPKKGNIRLLFMRMFKDSSEERLTAEPWFKPRNKEISIRLLALLSPSLEKQDGGWKGLTRVQQNN